MSLPANLVRPARSAYRDMIRAARVTFHGDPARHAQFMIPIRQTFLSPTLTPPSNVSDPTAKPEPEPCPCAGPPSPPLASSSSTSSSSGSSSSSSSTSSTSASSVAAAPAVEERISEEEVAKRIKEWKEVAVFLRRNVVQGELDETGSYRLRVTPETELGVNETTRIPGRRPKATKEQKEAVFIQP